MHFFYTPDIIGNSYTLQEEEARHCNRVLRLNTGDTLYLTDGVGNIYTARITAISPNACTVEVTDVKKEAGKRNHYLHIAIAPTKNTDRLEWFLEKATEIGIDEITPIMCDHSERTVVKTERLNKVIIAALKQSQKAYLPKLNELIALKKFVDSPFKGNRYIAHCRTETDKSLLSKSYFPGENALICIGPEGDFSEDEIRLAVEKKYQPVSLGQSRLRTETAALVACHTIVLLNDNM